MNLEEAEDRWGGAAAAVEAGSETQWAYWAALWTFPSPPVVGPWQPREKSTVAWLDADCLVTAEGLENCTIYFLGRPVIGSAWKFEATLSRPTSTTPASQRPA